MGSGVGNVGGSRRFEPLKIAILSSRIYLLTYAYISLRGKGPGVVNLHTSAVGKSNSCISGLPSYLPHQACACIRITYTQDLINNNNDYDVLSFLILVKSHLGLISDVGFVLTWLASGIETDNLINPSIYAQ